MPQQDALLSSAKRIADEVLVPAARQNALAGMDFDNPDHRPILEAEGLRNWLPPQADGYQTLREASAAIGLL